MRTVVALGGNALVSDARGTVAEMRDRLDSTAPELAALEARGHDLLVTHGNGPQVGTLLDEQRQADTPDRPLDVLVAETQAQIGTLVTRALDAHLAANATTVVTHVEVDPDDPAFENPTKPVGPVLSRAEAEDAPFDTAPVGDGEGYRRVVASPEPERVLETESIETLVDDGRPVVCAGGGGVPLVPDDDYTGVHAVVDKDHTSQRVGNAVGAETLVVATDVPYAYRDHGTPDQTPLEDVDAATIRDLLDGGEFGEGTMRPKIEACLDFLDAGGERAIITTPDALTAALDGETGTRIS